MADHEFRLPSGMRFRTPRGVLDLRREACQVLLHLLAAAGRTDERREILEAPPEGPVHLSERSQDVVVAVIAKAERARRLPPDLIALYHALSSA